MTAPPLSSLSLSSLERIIAHLRPRFSLPPPPRRVEINVEQVLARAPDVEVPYAPPEQGKFGPSDWPCFADEDSFAPEEQEYEYDAEHDHFADW